MTTDAQTALLITDDGPVRTVTLAREEAKNTLTGDMINGIAAAITEAADDPALRAVVVTNRGSTFCAGADLNAAQPGARALEADGSVTMAGLLRLMQTAPVPIIGKIAGHCVAGGMGIMAACDLAYIVEDAKVGFTEVRIGVAPAIISVVCLPKMRLVDAMEVFVTGERFDGNRAVALGLANGAVPAEDLDALVEEKLAMIVRGGPMAVAEAKRLVNTVPAMDVDDAFDAMTELSAALFESAEAQAGIAAFRSRSNPPWMQPTETDPSA